MDELELRPGPLALSPCNIKRYRGAVLGRIRTQATVRKDRPCVKAPRKVEQACRPIGSGSQGEAVQLVLHPWYFLRCPPNRFLVWPGRQSRMIQASEHEVFQALHQTVKHG